MTVTQLSSSKLFTEDKMIKIAITPPDIFQDEASFIVAILDAGWDYVHLRHPGATITDVGRIIESIPQRYHKKLKLHGHFELTNEFNLGGLHLNRRSPYVPALYSGKLSRSCHSVDETRDTDRYEYVTLSPIFDSVSKAGYNAAFKADELMSIPTRKIIALGGIIPDRIEEVMKYPFAGIAVLGFLFSAKNVDELRQRINEIDAKTLNDKK